MGKLTEIATQTMFARNDSRVISCFLSYQIYKKDFFILNFFLNKTFVFFKNKSGLIFVLFLMVSGIIFFYGLDGSLRDWDESVYAQTAKENLYHYDWYNLYWNGRPWIDKPPLMIWATRAVYQLCGVGQWQARFSSAFCGWLIVAVITLFGWRRISFFTGLLAGFILLGNPHFVKMSKMGHLDVPVACFITLSLLCFYKGQKKSYWFLLSGVFTAFAVLTKWTVGLFSPIIQLIFLMLPQNRKILKNKYWWLSFLVTAGLCAPGLIEQYVTYKYIFFNHFFGAKMVDSVNTSIAGHGGNLFYYLKTILQKARPWSFVFIAALLYSLKNFFKKNNLVKFLVIWFCAIFLLFSIAGTKLHWYIMPVYPPFALITAEFLGLIKGFGKKAVVLLAAAAVVPLHIMFSSDYLTLDLNRPMIELVQAVKNDIDDFDELYIYKAACTPSLIFYTDKKVTLLHSIDEVMEKISSDKKIFLVADVKDDYAIWQKISDKKISEAKPALMLAKYTAFFLE
ncbi:glycosyltransferase family 39 protein [bacterium]|nr:glycosyltransferase family 39 protein [bacterium]